VLLRALSRQTEVGTDWHAPGMHKQGFSLIELLVALAVLAILATLATPGLQRLLAEVAVTAAANQTVSGLAAARRNALTTGQTVTLCPTQNLTNCSFNGRQWMLFANQPGGAEGRREPGEVLLKQWPLPRGISVSGTRGYAAYLPQPRAASTLTFTFCHQTLPSLRRSVIVSQTGRARISVPASTPLPARCP
jgi:type IV fimbrial biogenesis protein FimT